MSYGTLEFPRRENIIIIIIIMEYLTSNLAVTEIPSL